MVTQTKVMPSWVECVLWRWVKCFFLWQMLRGEHWNWHWLMTRMHGVSFGSCSFCVAKWTSGHFICQWLKCYIVSLLLPSICGRYIVTNLIEAIKWSRQSRHMAQLWTAIWRKLGIAFSFVIYVVSFCRR